MAQTGNQAPTKHRRQTVKRVPQFLEVARELECPEDETAFNKMLKQIAQAGPVPKHQPEKRQPKP